jgi:hypothetical protein
MALVGAGADVDVKDKYGSTALSSTLYCITRTPSATKRINKGIILKALGEK